MDNKLINQLARVAGSPEDKTAGLFLHKKKNQEVKKGEVIMTIYTNSKDKLEHAKKFYKDNYKVIVETQ